MILRVGLTGGIGSGKSAVSSCFESHGVPVSDADVIAHQLTAANGGAIDSIRAHFGAHSISADGAMDRDVVRQIVFDEPARRTELESILHPLIRSTMADEIAGFSHPYCILAIPLLVEGGTHPLVDHVLVVDAPMERRIEWIKQRSQLSEERIKTIMAAQASTQERLDAADDVVSNDGTLDDLADRVAELNQRYLKLAQNFSRAKT